MKKLIFVITILLVIVLLKNIIQDKLFTGNSFVNDFRVVIQPYRYNPTNVYLSFFQ